MKKLLTLVLGITLSMAYLTGCSNTNPATDPSSNIQEETTEEITTDDTNTENIDIEYPTRAIQLIIPASAGGDTDSNGRLFAKYLEKYLGQSIGVTNVSGGATMIGTQQLLDASPDGYTCLWMHLETMIPQIAGTSDISIFDMKIAGIGMLADTTVLAVNKNAPYQTIDELVSAAKANPNDIEFAISTGGFPHLVGVALEDILDVDFNLVDVGGNAEKITALLAGQTDVINVQYELVEDYFETGDFVLLGLCSDERNSLIPDVPTLKEQGYDVEFSRFYYFGFPSDTPDEVVHVFSEAMEQVVNDPEFQAECEASYQTPVYMDEEKALEYINSVNDNLMQYQELFRAQVNQ